MQMTDLVSPALEKINILYTLFTLYIYVRRYELYSRKTTFEINKVFGNDDCGDITRVDI